jgi:hypothetical protein
MTFHALDPPELPQRLTPLQAAQLSELLEYLHLRIRDLLASSPRTDAFRSTNANGKAWSICKAGWPNIARWSANRRKNEPVAPA